MIEGMWRHGKGQPVYGTTVLSLPVLCKLGMCRAGPVAFGPCHPPEWSRCSDVSQFTSVSGWSCPLPTGLHTRTSSPPCRQLHLPFVGTFCPSLAAGQRALWCSGHSPCCILLCGSCPTCPPSSARPPAWAPATSRHPCRDPFEGPLVLPRSAASICLRNSMALGFNPWAYRVRLADPLCHPAHVGTCSQSPSKTRRAGNVPVSVLNRPQRSAPGTRIMVMVLPKLWGPGQTYAQFPGAPWLIWGRTEKHQARERAPGWPHQPDLLATETSGLLFNTLVGGWAASGVSSRQGLVGALLASRAQDSQLCGFVEA